MVAYDVLENHAAKEWRWQKRSSFGIPETMDAVLA